jgi:hypothetical protein
MARWGRPDRGSTCTVTGAPAAADRSRARVASSSATLPTLVWLKAFR